LSLYDWNGLDPSGGSFVGLANYYRLISDMDFFFAFRNNMIWVCVFIALAIGLGLILAVILSDIPRGRNFLSSTFLLPYIFSGPIVSIVWLWIYQPDYGLLNQFLRLVGLNNLTRGWLGDPGTALFCLIFAEVWHLYGFFMMLFLAGIQQIDPFLYDAAKVDGANSLQRFKHVTLPSLRNVMNTALVFAYLWSIRVFDIVWIMTPTGYGTEVVATYMFRQVFKFSKHGYGAAIAVVLTLIMLIVSISFVFVQERREAQ
jgi:raffinose/stachyose/melibiose transport system permease protein